MKGLLLAVLAAAALAIPAGATAHPGGWYWGVTKTENYLVDQTTTSDDEDLVDATCDGLGRPYHGLYHHLRCDETDDVDRDFTVIVHPVSRYRAVVIEIDCDDSASDLTCP